MDKQLALRDGTESEDAVMTDDERLVRETWEPAYEYYSRSGPIFVQFGPHSLQGWSAAAEFTRAQREEVRQVEEEIKEFGALANCGTVEPWMERILAREQAALDALKRGTK